MDDKKIPDKFLPLGSIVELDGFDYYAMIVGYRAMNEKRQRVFDYLGCLYPIGSSNPKEAILFNHNEILSVAFMGFEDERSKKFHKKLNKADKLKENNMVVDLREYTIKDFKEDSKEEKEELPQIESNLFK